MVKRLLASTGLLLFLMLFIPTQALALGNLDNAGKSSQSVQGGSDDNPLTGYMKKYKPITEGNMKQAEVVATPIVNAIGTVTGFVLLIVMAGVGLITAIDLAYIGIPKLRPSLAPNAGGTQAGGMTSPMGGRGMGMHGRGMMGGGMMGGSPQPSAGGHQWISDEALASVAMAGASVKPAGGGMPPMDGGMDMVGGGMMGGTPQQSVKQSSVIFTYLKKRAFFVILFAVALILLTSSVLLDCGINIAELSIKVFNKLNGNISNINVGFILWR